MNRALLAVLLAVAACQQLPQSADEPSGAPMRSSAALMLSPAAGGSVAASGARYEAAVVKDLEIVAARPADVVAMRDELARLFGASFREALQREGFVRLALPAESAADVVTIQSATMRVSLTELEIAVAVRDTRGRLLGWYAVEYRGESPGAHPMSHNEILRREFSDAGVQVAKAMAKAR